MREPRRPGVPVSTARADDGGDDAGDPATGLFLLRRPVEGDDDGLPSWPLCWARASLWVSRRLERDDAPRRDRSGEASSPWRLLLLQVGTAATVAMAVKAVRSATDVVSSTGCQDGSGAPPPAGAALPVAPGNPHPSVRSHTTLLLSSVSPVGA